MGKSLKDYELSIDDLKKAVGGQGTMVGNNVNIDNAYEVNIQEMLDDDACMNQIISFLWSGNYPASCSVVANELMSSAPNLMGGQLTEAQKNALLNAITATCIDDANSMLGGQLCSNVLHPISQL